MDAATLAREYEAFQEFHACFAPAFGRKQWRELQRFLTEARWGDDAVLDRLQEYLGPRLADPLGVWVLDGSDFPKPGTAHSECRPRCGTA